MPTKWRTYRDHRFCDVILPYVKISHWANTCGNSSLRTATGLFGSVATTGGQHAALLRAAYRRNASIGRAPTLIPVVDGGWLRSQRAAARNVIRHCRPSRRRRLPLESWRRRRQQPSNDLQVNVSLVACRAT